MATTVSKTGERTPEKSIRTDSQPTPARRITDRPAPATLEEVRGVSHVLRIDAKAEFLADINETRTRLGVTVEVMALNAGCPVSAMSEALAGKEGRNFAGHWLIAQGDAFTDLFNAIRDARRGRSAEVRKSARVIVEVVQQLAEKLA